MKKILSIFILLPLFTYSQKKKSIDDIQYKRNSLSIHLVSDGEFENKEKVLNAYNNYNFPDKYNDHRVGSSNVDLSNVEFSEEEFNIILEELGETKESYDDKIKIAKEIFGENYKDERLDVFKIKKFIQDSKMGSMIIDKWYDNNNDGKFDIDLITERGLFNASKEDIDKARSEATGTNVIVTGAALDLIPQTYVVFNKMSFVSNELMAAFVKEMAMKEINKMDDGLPKELAIKAAEKVYEKTSEGYSVWTTAFLFKFKWDEQDQINLYTSWEKNEEVKDEFLKNDFSLDLVGTEKANSLVTFSLKAEDKDRSEDDIINLATVRNVEKVFSKLTKNYEDFKPKVPLVEFKPLTAFIGMKEGLEGGETFEVLNEEYDSKTGRTIYKSVGKVKVDKKSIWDNRYSLDGEPNDPNGPDRTTFKGKANKATYGSLLRLIK